MTQGDRLLKLYWG